MWVAIAGLFLAIWSAYLSFSDKHIEFKTGKNTSKSYRTFFAIAIIGGLTTLGANISSGIEAAANREKADSLNNRLKRTQELNTVLLLEQKDSARKIIAIQSDMIDRQNQMYLEQTGGDIKPKLSATVMGGREGEKINRINFTLINSGKYPIYLIQLQLEDVGWLKNAAEMSAEMRYETRKKFHKIIDVGTVPAGMSQEYFVTVDRNAKEVEYHYVISWRNGNYQGNIRFDRDEKGDLRLVSIK